MRNCDIKFVNEEITATASKYRLPLDSAKDIESATNKFLESMTWDCCCNFRRECVTSWEKLFATKDVVYTDPIINNFLSFINHMSCSADVYVSLGGSNGCADQLTNWDGMQKVEFGTPTKRNVSERRMQHAPLICLVILSLLLS